MKPFDLLSNAGRAKEIASVLIRNGFADLLQKLDPSSAILQRFVPRTRERLTSWERLRLALEELGPTFVKFGQMLSMRPDVLPEALIVELRKLQDDVRPTPFTEMEPVLRAGLPAPREEIFAEFDPEPVASASLAQVYFARLRDSSQPVAVKVQRPGLRKIIEADFDYLRWFARQAHQRIEDLKPYNLPAVVEELREGIERELNFSIEARNAALFLAHSPAEQGVFAPRPFDGWSSETVLVMERVEGQKPATLAPGSAAAKHVANTGARSIFRQILVDGFFHADPHGGNLLVTPDGRVCFLDWGLVGQLTRRMRYSLVDLFGAFLDGDAAQVMRVATELGRVGGSRLDTRQMEREILHAMRDTFDPVTGRGQIGRAMLRLLHIFGANGIEVAQDYALVAKAVFTVEEAGNMLDPAFSLRACFQPAIDELVRERRNPREVWRRLRQSVTAGVGRLQDLPAELQRVLRLLEEGGTTINFHHRGLDRLDETINDASNKITISVIIGSLIIGSSLIVRANVWPKWNDYPVLGIVGYILSGVLGLWVVFDILRRGRRR